MDPRRFDEMARRLSPGVSRRSLVASSIGASLLAAIGLHEETAARKGKKNGKHKGNSKGKQKNNDNKRTICHCPNGDPSKCHTISVGKKAADSHLKNHCDYPGECRDDVINPCKSGNACLAVTDTEGDVTRASNGEYTATTEGSNDFGNLIFAVPAGTTFGDLATLESSFDFASGTCGGGSPRFVIFLENGNCPYAQFSTSACTSPGSTGNLIGENTKFIWNDDLQCGASVPPTPVYTYDEVLARYENVGISEIALVVDTSPSGNERTVTLEPCITLA